MAMQAQPGDRFDLELLCQHRGQYLCSCVGLDGSRLAVARAEARQEAIAHASAAGLAVEVTEYLTLQRAAIIAPRP